MAEVDLASTEWMTQGECNYYDSSLFSPDGNSAKYLPMIALSKAVCGECPVQQRCLQWAVDEHEYYGTWGGQTEWERKAARREQDAGMVRKVHSDGEGRIC
jgi:WhiB family transcriptional regulator, redox-sensing transcriptional regulator